MNPLQPMRRAGDRRNRRFRKGVYILPSLATTCNIAFGYYALWQTYMGSAADPMHYDFAAKAIGLAIVFDGVDGAIARMTNTASDFGRELDSLADVVTFGVAPAILAWVWGFRQIGTLSGHDFLDRIVQFGAIVSFAFLIAGACRLARFNIQANPKPWNPGRPGKKYFVGMPIPAGAGVIAATVHFLGGEPISTWWMAVVWGVLVFCSALLMVSTWRFYSFKDVHFHARQPFRVLIPIGLIVVLIWFFSHIVLFVMAMAYMLSGIVLGMGFFIRRGHRRNQEHPGPEYTEASEAQ